MKRSIGIFRNLGLILFFAGILLGMLLFGGLTWAHLEAGFYFGFGVQGETALKLTCPHIMAPAETGQVTITLANPSDRKVEPLVQVDVSGPLGRSLRERLPVEAGTTRVASWEVGARDLAFGHLILVKIYQFQSLGLSSADGSCGILVLNLAGLSGEAIYYLTAAISLLAGAIGFILWAVSHRLNREPIPHEAGGMLLLAAIVGIGVVVGTLGWWMAGLLAMAASLLLTVILIARRINASR